MTEPLTAAKAFAFVLAAAAAPTAISPGSVHVEWLHLEITTAFFGVPFNVLFAAALGSLGGVWNQKLPTRQELGIAFLGSTILAVTMSVLGPEVLNALGRWALGDGYQPMGWSSTGVHASAAMLLGFTAQNWGPELIRGVGPFFKALLRRYLPRKEGQP